MSIAILLKMNTIVDDLAVQLGFEKYIEVKTQILGLIISDLDSI